MGGREEPYGSSTNVLNYKLGEGGLWTGRCGSRKLLQDGGSKAGHAEGKI